MKKCNGTETQIDKFSNVLINLKMIPVKVNLVGRTSRILLSRNFAENVRTNQNCIELYHWDYICLRSLQASSHL